MHWQRKLSRPIKLSLTLLFLGAFLPTAHVESLSLTALDAMRATQVLPPGTPPDTLVPTDTVSGLAIGRTEGSGSVTSDGAAQYSIPLWVPPGRAGVQPALSLAYSSRSGNGPVGVGWALSGFSQITRCKRTYLQDGDPREIRFDNGADGDRFCLDGQRLVAVGGPNGSDSIYGADGTEYRTENDVHAKIVSYSADAYGPGYFKVYLKDGRILTLGSSGNSTLEGQRVRVSPMQIPDVRGTKPGFSTDYQQHVRYAWALSRLEDRAGNYMTVWYDLDNSNYAYELLPRSILYTAFAGSPDLLATRSIQFSYEGRPDVYEYYVGGFKQKSTKRLKRLEMQWVAAPPAKTLLRSYELQYRNDSFSKQSLLSQVQECDGFNICKPPTKFEWSPGSGSFTEVDTQIAGWNPPASQSPLLIQTGDIDGDGRDDIIYRRNNLNWRFRLNSGSGFGSEQVAPFSGIGARNLDTASGKREIVAPGGRLIDMNGDGRADMVLVEGTIAYDHATDSQLRNDVYLSTGSGYTLAWREPETWNTSNPWNTAFVLDMNGDGVPDLMRKTPESAAECSSRWAVIVDLPGSFNRSVCTESAYALDTKGLALDVNGSGKISLLVSGEKGQYSALGLEDGVVRRNATTIIGSGGLNYPGVTRSDFCDSIFVDVNGDRLADWVSKGTQKGTLYVFLNTGNGFSEPVKLVIPEPYASSESLECNPPADSGIRVIDYNGDGRQDLLPMAGYWSVLGYSGAMRYLYVLESTGSSFIPRPLPIPAGQDSGLIENKLLTQQGFKNWNVSQTLDANGDGLEDFIQVVNGTLHLYIRQGDGPDLLTRVVDGLGAFESFEYRPLSDRDTYVPGSECKYPQACIKKGFWVVSRHEVDSGDDYDAVDIPVAAQSEVQEIIGSFIAKESRAKCPDEWTTFFSRANGFWFCYPSTWTLEERPNLLSLRKGSLTFRIGISPSSPSAVPPLWQSIPVGDFVDQPGSIPFLEERRLPSKKLVHRGKVKAVFYGKESVIRVREGRLYFSLRLDGSDDMGPRESKYAYKDGRTDVSGRGWLGFAERVEIDRFTGTKTRIAYDNQSRVGTFYPCAALQKSVTTDVPLNTAMIFRNMVSTSCQAVTQNNGQVYFAYAGVIEKNEWEGNANGPLALVRKNRINQAQDTYGNIINTERLDYPVEAGEPIGRADKLSVAATYDNFDASWIIGQLMDLKQTSAVRSGRSITRETAAEYDKVTGLLWKTRIEPENQFLQDSTGSDLFLEATYERDAYGLVSAIRRRGSGETRTENQEYDDTEHMFLKSKKDAAGHTSYFTYHSGLGVLASAKDANGLETAYQYDGLGRIRSIDPPDNADVIFHYSSACGTCNPVFSTRPSGGVATDVYYDRLGRPLTRRWESFDGSWATTETTYDPLGRVSSVSLPHLQSESPIVRRFEYDNLNRLLYLRQPDGTYQRHEYHGLKTQNWDEKGNQSFTVEDELGRVASSVATYVGGSEIRTRYEYGPFGVLEGVTDADGRLTSAEYDKLGRRSKLHDLDSGLQITHYDAFGDVKVETDGNGEVTSYERDALGRVKKATSKDGVTTYTWDTATHGVGMLAATSSPDGIGTAYAYDSLSRLAEAAWIIQGDTYKIGYTHDAFSRLETLAYPTVEGRPRFAVKQKHTTRSDLQSVQDLSDVPYWTVEARNANGQLTSARFGNNVTTAQRYDQLGRLRFIDTQKPGSVLQALEYQYEPNGNLRRRYDRAPGPYGSPLSDMEEFSYDPLDRLTEWEVYQVPNVNFQMTYRYDQVGNLMNRTTVASPSSNMVYTYGESGAGPHAVTKTSTGVVTSTFTYDSAGNQKTATARTVDYTPFNLPSRIGGGATGDVTFKYDAFHTRVVKRMANGDSTVYIGGLYEKRTQPNNRYGTTIATHVFYIGGAERILAEILWTKTGGWEPDKTLYLHGDNLGSIETISDPSGNVVEHRKYDPFGTQRESRNLASSVSQALGDVHLGFTGHEHDEESRLINMNGRLYDPQIGRFLSADPLVKNVYSGQSYNRYSYVSNNPLIFTDPTGFQSDLGRQFTFDAETITGESVGREFTFDPVTIYGRPPETNGSELPTQSHGGGSNNPSTSSHASFADDNGRHDVPANREQRQPNDRPPAPPPVQPEQKSMPKESLPHDYQVVDLIEQYRAASSTPYEAWDRAREDYRRISLKGGDPVLRDAEHFLFRYWLASRPERGEYMWIPRPLPWGPSVADTQEDPWYELPVNSLFMLNFHDFFYNWGREHVLEHVLDISPTTQEMKDWELRGFDYGFCAAGDCGYRERGIRQQSLMFDPVF